ncbi:MAG: hypothetical protein ACT4R6_00470 [Gemmatimonadaceae bacterium]
MHCLTSILQRRFLLGAALNALRAAAAAAQSGVPVRLAPKRALAASGPASCAPLSPAELGNGSPRREASDSARELIAAGRDAALQGDHGAARDAFLIASSLVPRNAIVAYYLGREYEDLGEAANASKQYCRYLALLPSATDADEVRGRIVRLTPPAEIARIDEARAAFRSGVALLQQRQLIAADSAFSAVMRGLPAAPEPYYNRALARAARGHRAAAQQDFERYFQLAAGAPDQAAIRAAISRLQDRVWNPGAVFWQGLIAPGIGQMSTGRPIRGVFILALAGGVAAGGLTNRSQQEIQQYRDPFGNPYVDTVRVSERPYLIPAAGVLGAIWLLSAFEGSAFARGSVARARGILAFSPSAPAQRDIALLLTPQPAGTVGVGVRVQLSSRAVR